MHIKTNRLGSMMMNLLISLGIIALLSTISIPFIRNYQPSMKLTSAARNLTADIRYAQSLSLSQQVLHLVALDEAGGEYGVLKVDTSTTTLKTVIFDPEISFQGITGFIADEIKFNSYGAAYVEGSIILENTEGAIKTINVKPSGYVQLID